MVWSAHNGGSPVASSATVTLGSAVQVGQFMVALVMSRQAVTMPSGWSLQYTGNSVASEDQRIRVYTKISDVSGAGNTVTVENTSEADRLNICAFGFSYTGEVVPYLSQFGSETESGAQIDSPINYTLLTTGCPIFAATTWARQPSGATTYVANGQFNGGSTVTLLTGSEYSSANGSGVLGSDGSRLGAECKINPAPVGYVANVVNHDWFAPVKDFASVYFLVTCGKT